MSEVNQNLKNALEAVVFASGEPLELQKAAQAFEVSEEQIHEAADALLQDYQERNGGIALIRLDDKLQFVTKHEHLEDIRKVLDVRRNQPLSQAAFEVLAIVAYNQPVTKSFVEQVRGVDCSGVIGTLCQRDLIEECGRLDLPGRPLLYCTTTAFLRCFCLSSLDELPPLPEDSDAVSALEGISNADGVLSGQISIL
ncbi:MAG: SMC-Scp complex subunit ScpB [Clostridia bacterium]|nr:SMC-Scp complex subunit ScpB [Clostridia bacterium]